MLIESIIKRPKGTNITLGAETYNFRPDEKGRHVAEVEDSAHIATLLAIRDGFRAADGELVPTSLVQPEGSFFIFRGAQDAEAFRHWASLVLSPDDVHGIDEPVLLIDKICTREAGLGVAAFGPAGCCPDVIPHIFASMAIPDSIPAPAPAGPPPASEPSPRTSADNTILPQDHSQQDGNGADISDAQDAGDGGAGAAGGAGADTSDEDDDEQEEEHGDGAQDTTAQPLDREALAKEYDELVGHRPNGKWSPEKIAAALAELKAKG
jgi:hypothetical protein